jgi:hypothetical protein
MNKVCEYTTHKTKHPAQQQCFRAHHFPHWMLYVVAQNAKMVKRRVVGSALTLLP